MGFFSNLTQIYYNDTVCNGINYLTREVLQECFTVPTDCCDSLAGKKLNYNQCINGTVNMCTVSNQTLEELGYILQLFGILCLTAIGTLVIYAFCRFVCYREAETLENELISQQRKKLIMGGHYSSL